MIDQAKLDTAIFGNLYWFNNSGILKEQGKAGVHERILLLRPEHHLMRANKWDTQLDGPLFQYYRVDCAMQTALAFAQVEQLTPDSEKKKQLHETTQNLIDFVFNAGFQENRTDHEGYGLFAHGLTNRAEPDPNNQFHIKREAGVFQNKHWVDDNSWLVIASYALSDLGYKVPMNKVALCENALATKKDYLNKTCRNGMATPHWGGMRVMALGFSYAHNRDQNTKELTETLAEELVFCSTFNKDLSNNAYLAMQLGSIISIFDTDSDAKKGRDEAMAKLIFRQQEDGHLPSEWWEGPKGDHLSDLICGQNWATLALQIASQRDPQFRPAFEKSLEFLMNIQNTSGPNLVNGAWQGAYDTKAEAWGGEDKKEGGPSSIYSGWTNAPILLALATEYLKPARHPLVI